MLVEVFLVRRVTLTQLHAHQLWSAALGYLQIEIPRPNFETWLKDTTGIRYQDDTLIVGTRSPFAAEMLSKRLASTITRALGRVAKKPTDVAFEVIPTAPSGGAGFSPTATVTYQTRASDPTRVVYESTIRLNPIFTFHNFIVGSGNQLAYAAAKAVAEKPGSVHNPLYLWSKVGLGKTHLLQAIAQELLARSLAVVYVSSEHFTNEYIQAIRDGKTDQFRKRYRSADALLVDDIQFIAGKKETQEGFFHTFNELQMLQRPVIVTGDEPASLSLLQERIRSRLQGGLTVDIQAPDYETRVAILRKKADALGVTLSLQVLDLLARRNLSNVRELEGCLNRIVAYAHLTRAPLTVETVNRVLADMLTSNLQQPARPEFVISAVAEHFGIDVSVICGRRRDKHTALARRFAMYLLREESSLSSTRIGTLLGGKDHSTVLYAQKRLEAQIEQEPLMRQDLALIRQHISRRQPS